MKILFCAAEMDPYAKAGGLGDVAAGLPRALTRRGHDVRVVIPCHASAEPAFASTQNTRALTVPCPAGGTAEVTVATLAEAGAPTVLIARDGASFPRPNIYGYADDVLRYGLFCRVVQALMREDWVPDILHLNDWHTAPLTFALRNMAWSESHFRRTASVLTIHNLRYRGPDDFTDLLGPAIYYADEVTTVSPTYAAEIRRPWLGEGLDDLLNLRWDRLTGILNGLDGETFNPATDRHLVAPFSASTLPSRGANRAAFRAEFGLAGDGPVLSVVSRLTEQKGIDLVVDALPRIVRSGAKLFVLGSGDVALEAALLDAEAQYPGLVHLAARFDEGLARRVYAGSDMFLMPSRFEPCGLGQMIAMRYGCVPIARRTGGLADTVLDPWTHGDRATGYLFDDFSVDALMQGIEAGLNAFSHRDWWQTLQRNGMAQPFSWDEAAAQYEDVYRRGLSRH